ncbi:MAG: hypothetical protein WBK55_08285 [Alphaproteobacteria bacterium]
MSRKKRSQDWAERLAEYLVNAQSRPFEWGAHDCALHGANAVLAQTGEDFAESFRGTYSSARGAKQALLDHGHGDLQATVTAFLGPPMENKKMAQRGDLVQFDSGIGAALGVIDLSGAQFAAVTPKGLIRLPLSSADLVWRV